MDLTLPSGNTVTFRDKMMRDDIIAGRRALRLVTQADGSRVASADLTDAVRTAIYMRMITRWDFEAAVPGSAGSTDLADRMLARYLDEDDSAAMDITIQPWVDRVMSDPAFARNAVVHTSGHRFTAATEADFAWALSSGEFTAAEGPKATGQRAIGTTSSDSPNGPTLTEPDPTP